MSDAKAVIPIDHLANLARLTFEPAAGAEARLDLEKIITMIDAMQTVDTREVAPLSHPLDSSQRLRKDIANEHDQREKFQTNAPSTSDGYYLVPRVID
ncbi:MAG: Asp-tRNA(Asn)/Glu-tRNA(Gln) amidotransferase subunit GatC [Gammaproteobacteria bacterium TMED92]|nr:MAG: Asp-tRNA(Asn)/Glu-tRNA(Gln) amidotransferase subunit GatC [Gammaproteobacteria bacterium TMED92]